MQSIDIREIVLELPINAPVDQTWKIMLEELPEWWPQDFLCFPEAQKIKFEPRAGGRLYEETPDGRQILWATVYRILPGEVLEFIGHMTPQYGGPSITMVRLSLKAQEDGTTLFKMNDTIMGRNDEEHQADLTQGWTYLFENGLKEYVESKVAAGVG